MREDRPGFSLISSYSLFYPVWEYKIRAVCHMRQHNECQTVFTHFSDKQQNPTLSESPQCSKTYTVLRAGENIRMWSRSAWGVEFNYCQTWDLFFLSCQQCRFIKPTYEDENKTKKELKVNNLNRGRINVNCPSERERWRERTLRCSEVVLAFFFFLNNQAPEVVTFWFSAKSNNLNVAPLRAYMSNSTP